MTEDLGDYIAETWYAYGRVPGPGGRGFKSVEVGPFATAAEAGAAARAKHLGGIRVVLRPARMGFEA